MLEVSNFQTYKVKRERNVIVSLRETLQNKDVYNPVSVNIHFPECCGYHYNFICNIKKSGMPIANTIVVCPILWRVSWDHMDILCGTKTQLQICIEQSIIMLLRTSQKFFQAISPEYIKTKCVC